MTYPVLTEIVASISELKAHPMKVLASGEGMPVAILNRNPPAFYCVPAAAYEAMMELIDDMALLEIVKQRRHEESIAVSFVEFLRDGCASCRRRILSLYY
ncbi:MAG: type II toxin-antitoxin system Phd/YefM family antitoxin [Methylovulum sp.]|uniref:type II toxin-antitoxin system Phd/YefM family antitoxin n=1 Tax=Methylovulum sp. TaxID=1916980 RepID=UPI002619F05A|nr:type II toxin-antitoxin system Phd/YefM family antitoxin [Methylovulum sp.]MDD2723630.1 type II toxin-antitoxin system Phd/YefM family antitoxin [Methylovulum sp.]MDD5124305.1 type II toxin-antitoxin system Phd/YefM family antitoxin [Methylovulum sp.]